jgi:hypothetical protein
VRALLVEMADWPVAARFPATLRRVGFKTAVLATPRAMIRKSRFLDAVYEYPRRHVLRLGALSTAIQDWSPDFLIPCDDEAVSALCRVRQAVATQRPWLVSASTKRLLDRSLGPVRSFATKSTRTASLRALEAAGARVASFAPIRSSGDLRRFITAHGLPVVLKADSSAAGQGVRICRTVDEANIAFGELAGLRPPRPPLATRMTEAVVWGTDPAPKREVSAQKFIAGREAMRTFAALGGREVGGLSTAKIVRSDGGLGPATVVDFIEHPEMSGATASLARTIGYSGFGSVDFVVEDGTDHAYAIEFNARLTALVHLGHRVGHDLAGALLQALRGERSDEPRPPTRGRVTLFPREWMRDPSSPFLRECFVDVPTEEPEITEALIRYAESKSPGHGPMNLAAFCTDPMAILREDPQDSER